ncbi:hypothetical protein JZ751_026486 [Albula glossodonta]|uniref:Polymerase I and transcript release factor n=1 Tax=Albula glossodonta TaxID=121402 RepID=A0A8T2P9Q8_9TELE|nr:hypothetical protein JZ751_026486 [Albula glossodonta]
MLQAGDREGFHSWNALCEGRGWRMEGQSLENDNKRQIFHAAVLVLTGFLPDALQSVMGPQAPPPLYPEQRDEVKVPSKVSVSKSMKVSEAVEGEGELELKEEDEEAGEKANLNLSSDEEVEVEETIEESRAERIERIKRSSLQRVDNIKKVFSKEKMEKTKQRTKQNLEKTRQKTRENIEKTKENLEKTRQKTKENLERTRQNIEKKMGKLGTRMSVNPERKEKLKSSREKMRKSFTPDHTVYARSKTAVYKVPPFTFHVKKIREGEVEVQGTEMVEVAGEENAEEAIDTAEMLTEDSPEMQALLEMAEDSELVLPTGLDVLLKQHCDVGHDSRFSIEGSVHGL